MKKRPDSFSWKNSSTWKFFLNTLISFLVIVIFVTVAYYYFLNENEKTNLNNNISHIIEDHTPFLVSSLWITDYNAIHQHLGVIARIKYIDRVEVEDEDGTIFYTGEEAKPFYKIISHDLIYNYRDEQKKIGVLKIFTNERNIRAEVIKNTAFILLIEIVLSLILAAIIAAIFYSFIGRHLLQFAQFLEDDDPQKESCSFNLERASSRNDELQILVDHFNKLREQLGCYITEMRHFSYVDKLTDLYNHRFLMEELKRLDTERNLPLSVIVLDLDHLKLTNDTFGHAAGNKLLQRAAAVLKGEFRADEIIARVGGDEFVVLLPKIDKKQAGIMVKRVMSAFEREEVKHIPLSASFGWDTKENKEQEIASTLKKAEDHMYSQKLINRNKKRKSSIESILQALFKKEPREEIHSERVSKISENIALAMGMNPSEIYELKMAGKYHDIGKIALSPDILSKAGILTTSERLELKRHSELGYSILNTIEELSSIANIVLYHHERWDGKGYPGGLKGEDIPIQSRIIAVANAYGEMIEGYRNLPGALSEEEAIKELEKGAGSQFDPAIVALFTNKAVDLDV